MSTATHMTREQIDAFNERWYGLKIATRTGRDGLQSAPMYEVIAELKGDCIIARIGMYTVAFWKDAGGDDYDPETLAPGTKPTCVYQLDYTGRIEETVVCGCPGSACHNIEEVDYHLAQMRAEWGYPGDWRIR